MLESKYLEQFKKLEGSNLVALYGDKLIVEVLPKEELRSKGGLILQTTPDSHVSDTEENRHTLCVVLYVGAGHHDDEGNHVPLDTKPGQVIMLSPFALKRYTSFPGLVEYTKNTLALTRESEIHLSFPNIEAYEEYKKLLNT